VSSESLRCDRYCSSMAQSLVDSILHSSTSQTYILPLLLSCLFFLLALRFSEKANGRLVFYEQLGVCTWCNFNIPRLDSSPRLRIFKEMGKLPQISPKIDGALNCQLVVAKQCNVWKRENILSKGIIALHLWEKYTSLLLPISEEAWWTYCTSFS